MPTRRSLKAEGAKRNTVSHAEAKRESASPAVFAGEKHVTTEAATEEPNLKSADKGQELAAAAAAAEPSATANEAEPALSARKKKNLRRATVKERPVARAGEETAGSQEKPSEEENGSEKSSALRRGKTLKRASAKKGMRVGRIVLAVLGGILAAFILIAGWFCADRWLIHDDTADIQGAWVIYGSNKQVAITDKHIVLTSDVAYAYELDTTAKTITYTIGNMKGVSHYRFSSDRSSIALLEDGKQVFTATLLDDISWALSSLGKLITGKQVLPGEPDSATALFVRYQAQPESAAGAESAAPAQPTPEVAESEAPEVSTQTLLEPTLQSTPEGTPQVSEQGQQSQGASAASAGTQAQPAAPGA